MGVSNIKLLYLWFWRSTCYSFEKKPVLCVKRSVVSSLIHLAFYLTQEDVEDSDGRQTDITMTRKFTTEKS